LTTPARAAGQEPVVQVGLVDDASALAVRLDGCYSSNTGQRFGPGEMLAVCRDGAIACRGAVTCEGKQLALTPNNPLSDVFSIEATIGNGFHWQQSEMQTFCGALSLCPRSRDRFTLINHVPLETYLQSVVCSEMHAASPPELVKTHAVVSRSWLLAQLAERDSRGKSHVDAPTGRGEIMRWTDRGRHAAYDVCADDHCQRYQGVARIESSDVVRAITLTRGQVLTYQGQPCDARYSKCCGGITEEFRTAWGDQDVPYLRSVFDGPESLAPERELEDERAVRRFIEQPPGAYCHCDDQDVLSRILNDYDRATKDFFRWQVRVEAVEAGDLIRRNLGLDLGRIVSIEPVERGPSGRIKRMRLIGTKGARTIGKELEIRRVLSPSHLYSSAFVIDIEGPHGSPRAFVLSGAGWGHGVGLCQIGAAVMGCRGTDYRAILEHYYPHTALQTLY